MKKQLAIIGLVVLLVCVGLSGCTNDVNKTSEPRYLTYDVVNHGSYLDALPYDSVGWVEIKNTDSEPGAFKVTFYAHFADPSKDTIYQETGYIYPGETKRIEARYTALEFLEDITWTYEIIVPQATQN